MLLFLIAFAESLCNIGSLRRSWQPSQRSAREAASLLASSAGIKILASVNASASQRAERDLWWQHPGLVLEDNLHPDSLMALGEMYEAGKDHFTLAMVGMLMHFGLQQHLYSVRTFRAHWSFSACNAASADP